MNTLSRFFLLALVTAAPVTLPALSVWTNAGGTYYFSDAANWDSGVPASGADLSLASSDFVGLDNGGDFLAQSLNVQSGFSGQFLAGGAETFSLDAGGILNEGFGLDFQVPLLAIATQTWQIGSGSFLLGNSFTVLNGAVVTIEVGTNAVFDFGMFAYNPDWEGTLNFTGALDTALFTASGTGFSAQNLAQITFDGQAAQLNNGVLSAIPGGGSSPVPEPFVYDLFAGLALMVAVRHRLVRAKATA